MEGKKLGALLVILLTCLLFYAMLISSASGVIKFIVILITMAGCGISLQSLLKIDGQFGVLLLRTQKGLRYIDYIANAAPRLWQACADFGTVLGFGLSSFFIFKRYREGVPLKTFLFSMAALVVVSQTMTLKVFQMIILLISVPMDVSSLSQQMGSVASYVPWVTLLAMLFFGFCGVTVVGLILNTYSIIVSILSVLLSVPGSSLNDAMPGASPVIPGINMPLLEGIIALGVLLFVHEMSHGILSIIGKVRLESAGLLLFGVIPVGAFIDPDEKSLEKKGIDVQTRVFAAGSASNLIMFILFFFLLLGFEHFTAPFLDPSIHLVSVDPGSPAFEAGLRPGDRLISVEGIGITWENFGQFGTFLAQRDTVMVKTDKGEYLIQPKLSGDRKIIGIRVPSYPPYMQGYEWLGFLKNTIGLIFVLNFLVGVINLIPLFMAFDGYRILAMHMKNQLVINIISYSLLLMFLLNFVPWLWR